MIGTFASEPGETECNLAVWSRGRECRTCRQRCYRQGWRQSEVDADNKRLVQRRRCGHENGS